MDASRQDPRRAGEALPFVGVLLWAAVALVSLWLAAPPSPKGAEAPADDAAEGRARAVLERIARERDGRLSEPRPVASEANARCRARILDELRRLGLEPEVQEVFGVYPRQRAAGTVRNVVALLPGDGSRRAPAGEGARDAILCMAHYDSVAAGPGVGDDLAGVAAWLEVARALRAGPALARDVILLFEDGEEQGLLGAELFAQSHPLAERVGAVVNLEGRGNTGPSRMFETGPSNRWIVAAFGAASRAPSATSVSTEVYRRMPNDTDYSVWRERGIPGLNFAFIGGVTAYHTPLDDVANLSEASLQHHCTNALDAVRALAAAPFPGEPGFRSEGDAQFVSVGPWLVWTGTGPARALAVLALVLSFLAAAVVLRRPFARPGRAFLAALLLPLMAVGSWAAAHGARLALVELGFAAVHHPAHQGPLVVCLVFTALAAFALLAVPVGRVVAPSEALAGALVLLGSLALALGFSVVGASYLLVAPALAAALATFVAAARGTARSHAGASLFGLAVAALLWTGLHAGVLDAFGTAPGPVLRVGVPLPVPVAAAPLLVPLLLLAPCLMRAGATPFVVLGSLVVAGVAGALCVQLGAFSPTEPGHVNVVVETTAGQQSRVRLQGEDAPVERLERAAGAADPRRVMAPLEVPGRFEVLERTTTEDGGQRVRGRLFPGEGVDVADLTVNGGHQLTVDGVPAGSAWVQILGPDPDGHEVSVEWARGLSPVLQLRETRFGLWRDAVRGAAEPWTTARPPDLSPRGRGDRSRVDSAWPLGEDRPR